MKEAILIISFILDGIFSNFLPSNSIFNSLFTLVSLIIVYPYFNGNRHDYYKYAFILGLAYDLIYTDTVIFYAFVFLSVSFIISRFMLVLANNYLNIVIENENGIETLKGGNIVFVSLNE